MNRPGWVPRRGNRNDYTNTIACDSRREAGELSSRGTTSCTIVVMDTIGIGIENDQDKSRRLHPKIRTIASYESLLYL